jgi:hypothetical protein
MRVQNGLRFASNNAGPLLLATLLALAVVGAVTGANEDLEEVNEEIDVVGSDQPWYLVGTMPLLLIATSVTAVTTIVLVTVRKLRTWWRGQS